MAVKTKITINKSILESQALNIVDPILEDLTRDTLALARSSSYSPYQTGELRYSGGIITSIKGQKEILFNAPHSLIVHEQPQEKRKTGRARFLKVALDDMFNHYKSKGVINGE